MSGARNVALGAGFHAEGRYDQIGIPFATRQHPVGMHVVTIMDYIFRLLNQSLVANASVMPTREGVTSVVPQTSQINLRNRRLAVLMVVNATIMAMTNHRECRV